jgi:molybdopterin synthase catalytic subunit
LDDNMALIEVQLSDSPLDTQLAIQMAEDPSTGGCVAFIGVVRNQTQGRPVVRLDFEAYPPMAIAEMNKIANQVAEKWAAHRVVIHHRVGALEIGEVAVVIVVSTPHRKAAFEACQYAIDTLKETVPIWKKEIFADGEIWVAAHP